GRTDGRMAPRSQDFSLCCASVSVLKGLIPYDAEDARVLLKAAVRDPNPGKTVTALTISEVTVSAQVLLVSRYCIWVMTTPKHHDTKVSPRIGGMPRCTWSWSRVVVFCSKKIFETIEDSTGTSRKTTSINSKFNNALCLQVLNPFFVTVVPIYGCIVMLLFGLSWLGRLLELTTRVLFWIRIMKSLFTVIFVEAYRRAMCGALYGGLVKVAGPMAPMSTMIAVSRNSHSLVGVHVQT
ncbi:pyruvate dehydrogenase E1 component subunit beta, partial [Aphelenchoides avenae]